MQPYSIPTSPAAQAAQAAQFTFRKNPKKNYLARALKGTRRVSRLLNEARVHASGRRRAALDRLILVEALVHSAIQSLDGGGRE